MNNAHFDIEGLFPNQIKVYELAKLKKNGNKNSNNYINKHFMEPPSKEVLNCLIWEIVGFLKDQDPLAVYSFFYRSCNNSILDIEWFLSCSRLNKSNKGIPKELVIFTYNLGLFTDVKMRLYQALENNDFFKANFNKVVTLTKREKEIIGLLAKGMSTSRIASALFISTHTVNTHRKNINKKLAVENIAGLIKFSEVFDLTLK